MKSDLIYDYVYDILQVKLLYITIKRLFEHNHIQHVFVHLLWNCLTMKIVLKKLLIKI